jgi:UDP-N-acetylmuramoyl-L-alanyl-D-glutamate--2,6-diaminopimelate ligase
MQNFKQSLKSFIPDWLLKTLRPFYHGTMALLGNWYFGKPSDKLVVIGVTGTNGKSTTVNLIAKILEEAGSKVGFVSSVNFKIIGEEKLNDLKMTMVNGWLLQKWLRKMVNSGCQYAVLEVSSEGLAQNRQLGINFDIALFTNLTPEHLKSHGGFENYKQAKAKLFEVISKCSIKRFSLTLPSPSRERGRGEGVQKTIIVNADDQYGNFYASFPAQKHLSYGVKNQSADFVAKDINYSPNGVSFHLQSYVINLKLKGQFDVYNALAAITAAQSQGINLDVCKIALEKIAGVPGRMEVIQEKPFMVLVDYAPEPYALKACYETIKEWPKNRLIHILGSCGGGRDKSRRKILGEMAGRAANVVIVTNEDPYDDEPMEIIDEVANGALGAGMINNQNLFKVLDRREAIRKALLLAKENDLVLITGKGAEQKMAVANGQYLDWDDRRVVREELAKLV